jgi:cytochrome c
MDLYEVNKTAGWVLAALLVIFSGRTLLDIVYREHKPEKPGWALPVTEGPVTTAPGKAAPAFEPAQVVALLSKANPDAGQDIFKRCLQCHTVDKGGPNKVGPNLWGVVGRKPAQHAGFPYSEAMKKSDGEWSWEKLATYLHDPRGTIPGNKMAFAGIKDSQELADLLVYMRKMSDSPAPLPQ